MFNDHPAVMLAANRITQIDAPYWAETRETTLSIREDSSFLLRIEVSPPVGEEESVLHNLPRADFDETGFVGRDSQLEKLRTALLGAYPVITVTGEGGLGKSAIATKACYDLLDDPQNPFEAIIWATAKATRLTPTEIISIDNAITTSLGLFEDAANFLENKKTRDPIDRLLSHLSAFPTLLVIDNLETVLDENVRELVGRVPLGSKILFTSRTSIGAFDFPIPLEPLSEKEATALLRIASRFWSLDFLAKANQATLEGYCKKLHKNPLFIKWFVQAVASGKSPENVLRDRKIILKFCLSSVLEKISPESRRVLETLVLLGTSQNEAALVYYSQSPAEDVQRSLNELLASNLVRIVRKNGTGSEHEYRPSDMANYYLKNYGNIDIADEKEIIQKRRTLTAERERLKGQGPVDYYNYDNILIRFDSDLVAARYLMEANKLIKAERYSEAIGKCKQAIDLNPNYFECHRVLAFSLLMDSQILRSKDAFEASISLNPSHAPLRLWYGDFLLKHLDDVDAALEEYREGLSHDAKSIPLLLACARGQFINRNFESALIEIDNADKASESGASHRNLRRIADTRCQYYQRKLEHLINADEMEEAVQHLQEFRQIFLSIDPSHIDRFTRRKIKKMNLNLQRLEDYFASCEESALQFYDYLEWHHSEFSSINSTDASFGIDESSEPGRREIGKIKSLRNGFGFIKFGDDEVFFSYADWGCDIALVAELEGTEVSFLPGENRKGPCAKNVMPSDLEAVTKQFSTYSGLFKTDKESFGFIETSSGKVYFFPYSEFHVERGQASSFLRKKVHFEISGTQSGANPAAKNVRLA